MWNMWDVIDKAMYEREIEKACSSDMETFEVDIEFPSNIIDIPERES